MSGRDCRLHRAGRAGMMEPCGVWVAADKEPKMANFLALGLGSGVVGLIIFVLDIIAIVDVLKSGMDSVKKLVWILVILLLPVVGMIIYFLIGRK